MAINWAKVRQAMTQTPDYNTSLGGGDAYYNRPNYQGSAYRANQYNNMRNFSSRPNAGGGADYMSTIGTPSKAKTVSKSNPNAFANARALMTSPAAYGDEEEGGIMEVIKEKSGEAFGDAKNKFSNLTTPMMEMGKRALEGIGGLSEGIGRGIRLHNAYKDKYGNSDQYVSDKKAMMTGKDRDFYNKYMNLAELTSDPDLARQYRETADTAWRNQQTTDRLAFANQFEGYAPGKYTGQGEGSRYTGGYREGDLVPGYDRMMEILNRNFIPNPNDQASDRQPAFELGLGQAPDQYPIQPSDRQPAFELGLGQAPDQYPFEPIIRDKPDAYNPYRDEDYGAPLPYSGSDRLYPDEKYGAPTKGFSVKRKSSSFPFSGLGGSNLYLDYGDTGVELPYAMPEVEEEIVEEGPGFWERYFDANPDEEGFQFFNFN